MEEQHIAPQGSWGRTTGALRRARCRQAVWWCSTGLFSLVFLAGQGCGSGAFSVTTKNREPTGSPRTPAPSTPASADNAQPAQPDQSEGSSTPTSTSALCGPTAGGPHWVLEGDTLSFNVRCSTGIDYPTGGISMDPVPAGVSYDVTTGAFQWTPDLTQAQVVTLQLFEPSAGEAATVKVGVVDNFRAQGNAPPVDRGQYTEELGLPVLFVDGDPQDSYPDAYSECVVYRGQTFAAKVKLRGASSMHYPKKSYTLKFPAEKPFSENALAPGLVNRRKIVLTTTFNDNSYVRQRLGFDVWNALDAGLIKIRSFHVVLYRNGEYEGLYLVSDHVDRHLMEQHGLSKDGFLYKSRTHAANFEIKNPIHQGFDKTEMSDAEKQSGQPDYSDLAELIRFVDESSDAAFHAEADTWIRRADYESWWTYVLIAEGWDNADKNSYHYHNPMGGPWHAVIWDLDDSFGQNYNTKRRSSSLQSEYDNRNRLFSRLLNDPEDRARKRMASAIRQTHTTQVLNSLIDKYIEEIDPSARRDELRWRQAYRQYSAWSDRSDFTTYEEEVQYVRAWIAERMENLKARYVP